MASFLSEIVGSVFHLFSSHFLSTVSQDVMKWDTLKKHTAAEYDG